ncbi:hypothetical protein D3C78_18130 [compost metagenome]
MQLPFEVLMHYMLILRYGIKRIEFNHQWLESILGEPVDSNQELFFMIGTNKIPVIINNNLEQYEVIHMSGHKTGK